MAQLNGFKLNLKLNKIKRYKINKIHHIFEKNTYISSFLERKRSKIREKNRKKNQICTKKFFHKYNFTENVILHVRN